jgi:hypothetical protein
MHRKTWWKMMGKQGTHGGQMMGFGGKMMVKKNI